MVHQKSMSSL